MYGGRTYGRAYGLAWAGYNWWAASSGPATPSGDAGPGSYNRPYLQLLIRGFRVVLWLTLGLSQLA